MSGKFIFPSAKEAKAFSEAALSLLQKKMEKKRKRPLPNTLVVDDRAVMKSSVAEASAIPTAAPTGTSSTGAFTESSSVKSSRRTRSRSSKIEGIMNVPLPVDGSTYSDPSFIIEVADTLLLLANCKKLTDIGLVQSAEWSMAHIYQVIHWKFCFLNFFQV